MTREQVELLKRTLCKGATDDEFKLFMEVCRRKRMDPFDRQIHAVKRWDPEAGRETMTFQVGIDGLRAQAEETGEMDGTEGPLWCGLDGAWMDVWLSDAAPVAAKYIVWRKGHARPYLGIAHLSEYVQRKKSGEPNRMWTTMPAGQIAKCAEALALRKAFPKRLSGLYAPEELDQAGTPLAAAAQSKGRAPKHAEEARERLEELSEAYFAINAGAQFEAIQKSVGAPKALPTLSV